MPQFRGKFQYLEAGGKVIQSGSCQLQFDSQVFTLTPESGAAIALDLGDFDAVNAANWEIRLPIYTGRTIQLSQLAKTYDNLAHDLLEAYRDRSIQCLLLEDMEEIERYPGNFEMVSAGAKGTSGPAEIRLYKTNLAVLPASGEGFQWRLADVDAVHLDSANYVAELQAGEDRLKISRLAKRTEEFVSRVQDALAALNTQTTQALHLAFPFLDPDQLQSAASLMREGRSVTVARLAAISAKIPEALVRNAVDDDLRPYYDQLAARTAKGLLYAGYKLIRPEGEDTSASDTSAQSEDEGGPAPDADQKGSETLYWFFFPIAAKPGAAEPANVVAWEASSRSGRATYFFRLIEPSLTSQSKNADLVDRAIRRLNRVLAMVNFRRRPIYLSDSELASDPQFHRYAIAARRLREVREVRAAFLGRAIHSSPEAWLAQVESILQKAMI